MKNLNLKALDGVRGLAALYVMIGHARWLLWEGFSAGYKSHPDSYSAFDTALVYGLSFFSQGHLAVMLFFVLSGFLIHLRYAKLIAAEGFSARFDWSDYLLRRLKRLYPPLLGAIAVTFILDQLGKYLGYPIYFSSTPYDLINQTIHAHHSLTVLIVNLLFLMTAFGPVWGTNGPLWSLMYEFWFYMIYPLFWSLEKKGPWRAFVVLILIAIGLNYFPIHSHFFSWVANVFKMMTIWWLGVLFANLYLQRIQISMKWATLLALGLIAMMVAPKASFLADFFGGIGFLGLLAIILSFSRESLMILILNKIGWLGNCSYTLYVCHFPVLVFMSGFVASHNPGNILPQNFNWFFLAIAICLLLSYGLHFVFEKPFLRNSKVGTY